jgi:hypothetical protein
MVNMEIVWVEIVRVETVRVEIVLVGGSINLCSVKGNVYLPKLKYVGIRLEQLLNIIFYTFKHNLLF